MSAAASSSPAADIEMLQAALARVFAPWVRELELDVVAAHSGEVEVRLPVTPRHVHAGGVLCGQTLMAAADTAMVLALIRHFGAFRPCTTVQLNSSFLKPLSGQDALVEARVLRAGKALAFGEIDIRGAADGKSVSRASTTYALL